MVGEKMDKKAMSLEELNKAYKKKAQKIDKSVKTDKIAAEKKLQIRRKTIVTVGAVIVVLIVGIFLIIRKNTESDRIVPVVLTSEEQEKWDSIEVQEGKLYIELNGKIEVDGTKANIRLVNPIYSAYTIGIQLWEKQDENNLLYESERLMPGTILETIRLSAPMVHAEYECIVNYIVYDKEGNEKVSHPIDVKLIQKDIE